MRVHFKVTIATRLNTTLVLKDKNIFISITHFIFLLSYITFTMEDISNRYIRTYLLKIKRIKSKVKKMKIQLTFNIK